jgi:23S rRNA G2445 N2-methylase RlmL
MSPRQLDFDLDGPLDGRPFGLQTVDDVFVKVGEVGDVGTAKGVPADLARRLADLDWAGALRHVRAVRDVPVRPRFDVVASLAGRRRFSRYDVENAIGPQLEKHFSGTHYARETGVAPSVEVDLSVRVFLPGEHAVAAVRLASRPLHRRAYKLDTGPGTLHPPVAAALARLAGAEQAEQFVDPFCGDGTIAIEAALMFPGATVLAGDADPERVANARRNVSRAGVAIDVQQADAAETWWPAGTRSVATNPPWNRVVDARGGLARDFDRFFRRLPETLAPDARVALVADVEMDAPSRMSGVVLAAQVRLAGHVSHLVVAGRELPPGLDAQRRLALASGVITEEGW